MVSSLRSTAKSKPSRPPLPLPVPLIVFVAAWTLSSFLTRTSSTSMYDPLHSAKYTPPSQPPEGPPIMNSIIVPAYHERANVRTLAERVFESVARPAETELVIVDDNSQDGTEEECAKLKSEGHNVELLVRTGEKGLSSAVLRGFEVARGTRLVIMDADLQHPPEMLQPLLEALSVSKPIALGTRYGKGVSMSKGWPVYRRVISWGARSLARPLTSASDPMTGFFAITKDEFLLSRPINTSGFKIALELLLKAPHADSSAIAQIPYSFGLRQTGSSKLGARVMLKYVFQLLQLYAWSWGILFHLLVATGATMAFMLSRRIWTEWRAQSHPDELLPGGSTRRNGTTPKTRAGLFSRARSPVLESKRLV